MLKRFKVWQLSVAVVIAAAVLLALRVVVDALEDQRRRGEEEGCRNNLAQLALAVHNYCSASGEYFPQAAWMNPQLPVNKRLSWLMQIVPFTESIRWDIDEQKAWDSTTNLNASISQADWRPVICPAHPRAARAGGRPVPSSYVGIAGLGLDARDLPAGHPRAGVFGLTRETRLQDIHDGTSYTMMIADTTTQRGPWTAAGPGTVRGLDPSKQPYIGRDRQFGGVHHLAGTMAAFVDGSVRLIRPSIKPRVFEAMSTIAGGDSPLADQEMY